MYVGVGIEDGIDLLSKFLVQNLKEARLEDGEEVIFIPDSFEELLQTKKSVSGLWALGDVYAALKDYIGIYGEDSEITIKVKDDGDSRYRDEPKQLKNLQKSIRSLYSTVYTRRSQSDTEPRHPKFLGIPDRLPINLELDKTTVDIEDPKKSPAHLYASVNYMSIDSSVKIHKEIINLLLTSEDKNGWYVNGKHDTGLETKYGWSLFPRDNAEDNKPRLVDPIASLNVLENLAISCHRGNANIKEDNIKFIFNAWATSILALTSKEQKIISSDILSEKIISFIKENIATAKELDVDLKSIAEQYPQIQIVVGPDLISSDSHNSLAGEKFIRGYHDICRSLLAINGILKNRDFHKIIQENISSLSKILFQIIKTLLTQLEQDIISVDKIHDRGRVFRRSNGLVVQYIGVGSALILFAILQALETLQEKEQEPKTLLEEKERLKDISNEIENNLPLRPVVRTLIIKVLQQIMTQKHIDYEPTGSLRGISSRIKSHNILQDYEMVGGYVFDECSPGKADAYEFIFFWQSAYALRALLLCKKLAKTEKFRWLTEL